MEFALRPRFNLEFCIKYDFLFIQTFLKFLKVRYYTVFETTRFLLR